MHSHAERGNEWVQRDGRRRTFLFPETLFRGGRGAPAPNGPVARGKRPYSGSERTSGSASGIAPRTGTPR